MSAEQVPFDSLYGQGFVRVAVGVPPVRVADPRANGESTLALAQQASQRRAILAVFPELGLSCYSADDLFHQQALFDSVQGALARLVEASTDLACALVVGAPLVAEGRLFNCAVVIHHGKVARGRPEELPARLPGVLREAPVCRGP